MLKNVLHFPHLQSLIDIENAIGFQLLKYEFTYTTVANKCTDFVTYEQLSLKNNTWLL